jgi:hypothetical protein
MPSRWDWSAIILKIEHRALTHLAFQFPSSQSKFSTINFQCPTTQGYAKDIALDFAVLGGLAPLLLTLTHTNPHPLMHQADLGY